MADSPGCHRSTISTMRSSSVWFHASCSKKSSNTRHRPSGQRCMSSPTRIAQSPVGHGDAEMTPYPQVRRAPVGMDVGPGAHARCVDQAGGGPHRRVRLDPTRRHRTGVADVVVPASTLVEEHHVPVARSPDPLALALKPCLQSGDLLADRVGVRLQVADQREVSRVKPGPALELGVDAAPRRAVRRRRAPRHSDEIAVGPRRDRPRPGSLCAGAPARRSRRIAGPGQDDVRQRTRIRGSGPEARAVAPRRSAAAARARATRRNSRRLSQGVPRARSRCCASRAQSRAVDESPRERARWANQTHGSGTTGHVAAARASWSALAPAPTPETPSR